jgi:hypothetical protein
LQGGRAFQGLLVRGSRIKILKVSLCFIILFF